MSYKVFAANIPLFSPFDHIVVEMRENEKLCLRFYIVLNTIMLCSVLNRVRNNSASLRHGSRLCLEQGQGLIVKSAEPPPKFLLCTPGRAEIVLLPACDISRPYFCPRRTQVTRPSRLEYTQRQTIINLLNARFGSVALRYAYYAGRD